MFINKSSEEIDLRLKGPVLAESFNIAGHHISTSGYSLYNSTNLYESDDIKNFSQTNFAAIARKYKDDIISSHLDGQVLR